MRASKSSADAGPALMTTLPTSLMPRKQLAQVAACQRVRRTRWVHILAPSGNRTRSKGFQAQQAKRRRVRIIRAARAQHTCPVKPSRRRLRADKDYLDRAGAVSVGAFARREPAQMTGVLLVTVAHSPLPRCSRAGPGERAPPETFARQPFRSQGEMADDPTTTYCPVCERAIKTDARRVTPAA